ncbi:MAG: 2-keto-4-pentenoate hydratase [Acetobacteraceae bacterium]
MDRLSIDRAAAILVKARRSGEQLSGLPDKLKPASIADAHAIQDATTAMLGKLIGGFKAMNPAEGEPTRGIIYAGTIMATPADMAVWVVPQCGVEGEVAFIFRTAFPPRQTPYTREEVAAGVDACAAIEVVSGRFAVDAKVTNLEKLADSIINGGLVHDMPKKDWRGLDLGKLKVTLTVNGQVVLQQDGGHPTGDPLGVATALVNMWQQNGGVRAGQFVTCGSFTGLKFLQPGDVCGVTFEGLGSCRVEFTV